MSLNLDIVIISAMALPASAFLAVAAWKLWRGQWLRFIAGNTFATEEEMRLPYQRRMGRDAALLMAACALTLAFMACERLFDIERELCRANCTLVVAVAIRSLFKGRDRFELRA